MNASYPLISSNVETRLDGTPKSGGANRADPGVCLYFTLKGKPHALACDAYTTVAQNLGALAAHLEATRAIERHGVATAAETLQAFQALPPPAGTKPARPWWEVFGVDKASVDVDDVKALFRVKAKKAHPDQPGGSVLAMAELNSALQQALNEL